MYPSVKSVQPLPEYCLELVFDNGDTKIFDMKPYLDIGMFRELMNENVFKTVRVSFDTIEWQNGIDFDPEVLYSNSIAKITVKSHSHA